MQTSRFDEGWVRESAGLHRPRYAYQLKQEQVPSKAEVPNWKFRGYEPSDLQACTASAIAAAVELLQDAPAPARFRPSTAFIYFVARYLRMDEMHDRGASIYDGLRGAVYFGFCSEADWPIGDVRANSRPSRAVQERARHYGIEEFFHISRASDQPDDVVNRCRAAINSKHAVLFGALVDDAFLNDDFRDHMDVRVPSADAPLHHHHCLLAVKYDDHEGGHFWVRDSLGPHRGDSGYLRMPYQYLREKTGTGEFLTDDFWAVTRASTSGALSESLEDKRNRHWDSARALAHPLANTYRSYRGLTSLPATQNLPEFPPDLS
jgi:C1A family cysteine protease